MHTGFFSIFFTFFCVFFLLSAPLTEPPVADDPLPTVSCEFHQVFLAWAEKAGAGATEPWGAGPVAAVAAAHLVRAASEAAFARRRRSMVRVAEGGLAAT